MSWENFSRDELACSCGCRTNEVQDDLIDALQRIRTECGFPFVVTSGYRCRDHVNERTKTHPGTHNLGLAADIAVSYGQAHRVLEAAMADGAFTGIGVNQRGNGRFLHLDIAPAEAHRPRPTVWSY